MQQGNVVLNLAPMMNTKESAIYWLIIVCLLFYYCYYLFILGSPSPPHTKHKMGCTKMIDYELLVTRKDKNEETVSFVLDVLAGKRCSDEHPALKRSGTFKHIINNNICLFFLIFSLSSNAKGTRTKGRESLRPQFA